MSSEEGEETEIFEKWKFAEQIEEARKTDDATNSISKDFVVQSLSRVSVDSFLGRTEQKQKKGRKESVSTQKYFTRNSD